MVMLADSCSFLLCILRIFCNSNPDFIKTGTTQSCASINIYKRDRKFDIKRQIERKSNTIYMTRGVFVLIYTFCLSVFLSVRISLPLCPPQFSCSLNDNHPINDPHTFHLYQTLPNVLL